MKKHTLSRILCAFLAVLGFLTFCVPLLFTSLNLGGVTGIFLSALALFWALFAEKAEKHIRAIWHHKAAGRVLLCLLLLVLLTAVCFAAVFTVWMIRDANRTPAEDSTLVVLGCRVYGSRPSRMLTERIDAAFDYLNQHPGAVCILSGGQGEGEDISEAECMYRMLTQRGIDPSRLYLEEKSTSTRENLAFSHEIIVEEGLCEEIAVATNEFHCCRALMIAADLGYQAAGVPARTALYLFPTYYLREIWGILYECLF